MFHDEGFLILIGIYPESVGLIHAIYVIVSWLLHVVFALIPLLKKWIFSLTVINRISKTGENSRLKSPLERRDRLIPYPKRSLIFREFNIKSL